jgi:Phosphoesterase family
MHSTMKMPRPSLVAAAVASTLTICSASAFASSSIVKGVVGGAYFTAPVVADTAAASAASSTVASVYQGAKVCFDLNDNGACDANEPFTTTAADGSFQLSSKTIAPLVAEIGTNAQNGGHAVTSRNVFRVKQDQIAAATVNPLLPANVAITPLSTEVARMMEANGLTFVQAVDSLASRLNVSSADVLLAPTKIQDATELPAILKESVVDAGRWQLAAKFVDRGDTIGELRGNFDCPNVASFDPSNSGTNCQASDANTVAGIKDAQQYANNLEGIPRYDYVFVIIEENESLSSLKNAAGLPYMNNFIDNGSQFYNYFSTGNPSEPNYLALGSADDWGATSDEGIPYPSITGTRANMSTSIDSTGLTWHHYEESLWPSPAATYAAAKTGSASGGAFFDNPAESTIKGTDGSTYPASIRGIKHNTVTWFADVTAQPNYLSNLRTIGGTGTDLNGNVITYTYVNSSGQTVTAATPASTGDWDAALQSYAATNGITSWWTGNTQPWTVDQFSADLQSGNVGNYNVIVPDQDDDMHNTGTVARADYFFENIVKKIQSSPLWNDPNKRVAIVVTFDEGEASAAPLSCCGWNAGSVTDTPVAVSSNGTVSAAPTISGTAAFNGAAYTVNYAGGNKGHGVTMFGLLTNQQVIGTAPHGHFDTDYYSHFSFVRTLQDMFGLSDPGQPGTYMNRSKYTENFINANATLLPEFAGSANPHFDAVRSMNHVYQFPAGVARRIGGGELSTIEPVAAGPDPDQVNPWALQ